MKYASFRHAAVGLLAILMAVSTIIVLIKTGENRFFYGGTLAAVLLAVILIDTWRTMYAWKDVLFVFIVPYVIITLVLLLGFYYGWPFGLFQYTNLLGYELNSIVPWTVPIIWIALIAAALPLTRRQKKSKQSISASLFTWAFDTAVLATLMDLVIEPAVVAAGLKQFAVGSGMYDVPFQHFLGFFITTFIVTSIIIVRINGYKTERRSSGLIVTSVMLLLSFFTVLSGTQQLPFSFMLGILILVWLCWKKRGIINV